MYSILYPLTRNGQWVLSKLNLETDSGGYVVDRTMLQDIITAGRETENLIVT